MIRTSKFTINKDQLFKIIFSNYLKRRWWMFLIIAAIFIYLLYSGKSDSAIWVGGAIVALPLVMAVLLWIFVYKKMNSYHFEEQYLEIYSGKIRAILSGNRYDEIGFSDIKKIIRSSKEYLLITKTGNFIIIPKNIFRSGRDEEAFSNILSDSRL